MKSFEIEGIGAAGKARLLEMIALPRSGELSLVVIPPLMTAYYTYVYGWGILWLWPLAGLALAVSLHFARKQSLGERAVVSDGQWVERWVRPSHWRVAIYGGIWATPLLLLTGQYALTGQQPSFEFSFMLYSMLACNMAICTNSLSSLLRFFERYLLGGWIIPVLLIPWMFPRHWPVLLPLCILLGWIAFQHARRTHGFLVRQVQLEEQSQQLSEQYRHAKEQAEAAQRKAEQAQQSAERALREKSEFLRTASHDLRQPVHAMGLLAETIAQQSQEPQLKPLLRDLQSGLRSVNLMFNSLLDLSKLEVSDRPSLTEPVRLQSLMDELTAIFKPEAQRRGLAWRVRMPRVDIWGEAWVQADAALLRQAVFNLTHNALRYTSAGGVLVGVRARLANTAQRPQAHWQIEVSDTGAGIAQSEQGKVFSPYYRNEHAWKIDSVGLGLGLAVFKQCVQRMSASDGMRSVLGRGSRFWISLPQAKPLGTATTPLKISASMLAQRPVSLHGRCLIVDDDPLVRNAWSALLASWGLQVQLVADSPTAFACIETGFEPQVIFCDQRLRSGESGFDVLQALMARCPLATGCMVSGEFDAPELLDAQEQGYTVLRKPVEPAVLYAVLARWLSAPEPDILIS
jgi:signal transduction histidine kinase